MPYIPEDLESQLNAEGIAYTDDIKSALVLAWFSGGDTDRLREVMVSWGWPGNRGIDRALVICGFLPAVD